MAYGVINSDLMTTSDGVSSAGLYGFKNKLINGDARIDQRNNGASVTVTTAGNFSVDRWQGNASQSSKFTMQQNAGSVTPPPGFSKYIGITSTAATSVGTNDYFTFNQWIEGNNIVDLSLGTASASFITVSFWVRSSLTGTFGGALQGFNGSTFRNYPITYTISSANTWEQKYVTIAGDTTSFAYNSTNGYGLNVVFSLGAGSTYSGTAGAWASGNIFSATGATSVVGTNGATFYITGVQLEKGTTATSFEYLDYGRSLAQCQRYYWRIGNATTAAVGSGTAANTTTSNLYIKYPVSMRATPTFTQSTSVINNGPSNINVTGISGSSPSIETTFIQVTVASGLTASQGVVWLLGASGYVDASSDARIKTNVRQITGALQTVLNLEGVVYDRVDVDLINQMGFIAQQIKPFVPEIVNGTEEGGYRVSYQNITALLVEAIKDLNSKLGVIALQEKAIKDLNTKLEELQRRG